MSLSRREFLETGARSGTALALSGLMKPFAAYGQQAQANSASPAGHWPLSPETRIVQSFDRDWRFTRIDSAAKSIASTAKDMSPLNDASWEQVNLPHSVRLEPLNASGGRNYQGLCWYQKRFAAPTLWRGRTLHLVFQGAMSVADVWLNGKHLTTHYGGYIPFVIDITTHADYGDEETNVLTVLLNNEDNADVPPGKPQDQLDFVYFGGLYRSVQLEVLGDLHISHPILANKAAGGGIFVTYPAINTNEAVVQVQTDVANASSSSRRATVRHELLASDGSIAAKSEKNVQIGAASSQQLTQTLKVLQPELWHPYHPHLYTLHTIILEENKPIDDLYTRIGIRKFHMDREQGLFINGEKFFSQGANRHQDHPYVGYALPASAHYRDAIKLRDAGFTSYRCHYPQHPAFMDACDELGILGIVSNPGWQYVADTETFRSRVYQDAREMIRRDRNHACVLLWEAQLNETDNESVAAELYRIVHEEYPGPDCYAAGDRVMKSIQGFPGWDVEYSRNDGTKPLWVREWGDQVDNWTDQQGSVRIAREWGETPMLVQAARHLQALNEMYAKLEAPLPPNTARAAGADLWAGIDYYRGYHHQPFYGSPLDLFRLPKFDYYFFQSQRPVDAKTSKFGSGPMIFVASFATFQSPTTVTVFSNCDEVRLTQNGKVIATQKPDEGYQLPHPPFTFRLEQFSELHSMLFATGVAKPGTPIGNVKAEGLMGGAVVATHELNAPGVQTQLKLVLDDCGRGLTADGSDWIRIYAHVCDARGTTYPYGDDEVAFEVSGEGTLIGDASILANPMRAQAGIATALIRATIRAGEIKVRASAFGLKSDEYTFSSQISEKL
ncbi:beta-galactosidase [Silvibacterium bohemicum]|uniref:Beta-galactosidase n=1 Tax=Silvibacterium bohemicum TaxID=1577686 RepID=A0A841JW33_9BACT|nr:glycoside hydrolase family 2 TIM barrel-domain containing protein [Silvibacterium bohemicum]MBB6143181.1 beta-galactosidase [Silvibacterium bohemicum]